MKYIKFCHFLYKKNSIPAANELLTGWHIELWLGNNSILGLSYMNM